MNEQEHEHDSDVLRRIRDGDVTALAAYLDAHRAQLLAFIRRRLGTAPEGKGGTRGHFSGYER